MTAPELLPLAERPQVLYRMYDASRRLLYVGITANPGARLVAHEEKKPWWGDVQTIELEHHSSRDSVERAERRAICTERPRHNLIGQPYDEHRHWPAPTAHAYNRQRTRLPFHLFRLYDDDGDLLYIGITTSVKRRLQELRWKPARVESKCMGARPIAEAAAAVAIRDERPKRVNATFCHAEPWMARLTQYLGEKNLSAAELAEQLEIDECTVRSWLGKQRTPDGTATSDMVKT